MAFFVASTYFITPLRFGISPWSPQSLLVCASCLSPPKSRPLFLSPQISRQWFLPPKHHCQLKKGYEKGKRIKGQSKGIRGENPNKRTRESGNLTRVTSVSLCITSSFPCNSSFKAVGQTVSQISMPEVETWGKSESNAQWATTNYTSSDYQALRHTKPHSR